MRWINALVTGFVVVTTLLFTAEPSGALLQAKARSEEIALRLQPCATVDERAILLSHDESYEDVVSRYPELKTFLGGARPEERYVIGLMIALNQSNTLFDGFQTVQNKQAALQKLASRLV